MNHARSIAAPIWGHEGNRPPDVPDNWYMLAASHELRAGRILTRELGASEVVLFRGHPAANVTAFAANCAHMGCHLRHGKVEDGGLRCGLHGRLIELDGRFGSASGLKQRVFPATERFGMVFIWSGTGPPRPLPLPELDDGEVWTARPAGRFSSPTGWASLVANGFDMEHLATIHRRRLIEPAEVTVPNSDAFRLSYRSRVAGRGLYDRLVKLLSGNEVHATMTSWRGSMMFVESELGRRRSFFILSMCPRRDGGTEVRCVVGLKHQRKRMLDGLKLRLTAMLFRRFLADDFAVLSDLSWHPPLNAVNKSDLDTQKLGRFFAGLAQSEGPA